VRHGSAGAYVRAVTQHPEHPGLVFRTLDPAAGDARLLQGWFQAVRRGFHEGRGSTTGHARWLEHVRTDAATLRGAWPEHDPVGSGTIPVATFTSWASSINVGGPDQPALPAHLISDVTVAPTHRRRGLLRRLMTADLADAAAAGFPIAALTVSEGSIYGRFGFGAATFVREVEVEVTSRFGYRADVPDDDGSLVLAEPAEAWKTVAGIFARFHEQTRGSVARPQFYEPWLSSAYDFHDDSTDETRQRVAVHLDAAGTPDGYAIYKVAEEENDGRGVVTIVDVAALTPAAYLRLWRLLADIDLVERVVWKKAPVEDPLYWALVEPFAVRRAHVGDYLWVRVLDVERALTARPWGTDGTAVLGVDDPLGHAAGRFRVAVVDGRAEVTRTEAEPDVTLAADTLGALYLGGVGARTLAASGRLGGSPEAVATWAAMCDAGPAPYCITGF